MGVQTVEAGLIVGLVACSYVYFALYIYYVSRAWASLRGQPYAKFKWVALRGSNPQCTPSSPCSTQHACTPGPGVEDSPC